jgi:hypothetical protein
MAHIFASAETITASPWRGSMRGWAGSRMSGCAGCTDQGIGSDSRGTPGFLFLVNDIATSGQLTISRGIGEVVLHIDGNGVNRDLNATLNFKARSNRAVSLSQQCGSPCFASGK